MQRYQMYLDGKHADPVSGKRIDRRNPFAPR